MFVFQGSLGTRLGPIGKGADEGEEKEKAIKRQVRWRGGDGGGEEEMEEGRRWRRGGRDRGGEEMKEGRKRWRKRRGGEEEMEEGRRRWRREGRDGGEREEERRTAKKYMHIYLDMYSIWRGYLLVDLCPHSLKCPLAAEKSLLSVVHH